MSPRHLMRVLVLPKSLVERRALIVPAAGCLLVLRKQHVVSATRLADALLGLTELLQPQLVVGRPLLCT